MEAGYHTNRAIHETPYLKFQSICPPIYPVIWDSFMVKVRIVIAQISSLMLQSSNHVSY